MVELGFVTSQFNVRRLIQSLSPQLTVLAAATVIKTESGLCLFVALGLARDAQPHAGHRFASCLGNRIAAFLALAQARSARQQRAGSLDRVLDAVVNLLLYRAVAGPTRRHDRPRCSK